MAHAHKPDFVFRRNGRIHLNRRGRQFSRLLAAEVCASAVVMLDTPCSEVVATHFIRQFPLNFPSLHHRVPSHFNWTLPPKLLRGCRPTTAIMTSICTGVNNFHGRPGFVPGEGGGVDALYRGDAASLHQKIHKRLAGFVQ
jgi:hypothetical protein